MMALFPALIAIVSVYGLVADSADVIQQVTAVSRALPWTARTLITEQLTWIAEQPTADLTVGLVVSVTVALFSASSGVVALMKGVNTAYDEEETRGWLRQRVLALFFTVGVSLFVVVAVGTITLLPSVLAHFGLAEVTRATLTALRWPTLGLAVMAGLAALYRYAPQRTPARWPWVMWGAVLATGLWIVISLLFAVYAENFGRFNKTYGTLGGVVVLLLWMYLSSLAILLGAELNAELEHQTSVDTTIGPPKPLGERAAFVADTLGEFAPTPETRGQPTVSERLRRAARAVLVDLTSRARGKVPGAAASRGDSGSDPRSA